MHLRHLPIRTVTAVVIAWSLSSLAGAPAVAADRMLTIDDILALTDVSDPAISPDGAWVAYIAEQVDKENDKKVSSLRMVSTDGAETVHAAKVVGAVHRR